jgi:hypothetical protein
MQKKRAVGRPRKTLNDLPNNWKQLMLASAKNGGGRAEWQAFLGVSNNTWDGWMKNSEEFKVAVEEAKILCQVWWENQGRRLVTGANGNGTIWAINMKNRFGWRYKANTSSDIENPTQTNESAFISAHMTQAEASQIYMDFCSRPLESK